MLRSYKRTNSQRSTVVVAAPECPAPLSPTLQLSIGYYPEVVMYFFSVIILLHEISVVFSLTRPII
jgi:hypothetical protein